MPLMQPGESEPAASTAVLRFRHSVAAGSGVSRRGHIRPGGWLVIEYDPARLPPAAHTSSANWDIVCHVRFSPGDQLHSGSVLDAGTAGPRSPFGVEIPRDATNLEIWFERRGPTGTIGWDSRYGQNYSFVVIGQGLPVPEPSVALRPDALVSLSKIRVVADAATKEAIASSSGKRLSTGLVVRAQVEDPETDAWAEIHIFDATGELIHARSVILQDRQSGDDDGALFVWEDDVYEGSGGGSGIGVWSRPDAQTIQYRVYCRPKRPVYEAQAAVFTDGILHEFEVPADEDASGH